MLKQIVVCALLLTLGVAGSAIAQTAGNPNDVPMPPVIEWPQEPYADAA